jgi:ubiquinone/menaquinone biosynthesis C-methylase UbiE
MLTKLINLLFRLSPNARVAMLRRWYEFISRLDQDEQMLFMNYGYVSLDSNHKPLELLPQDEKNRYFIQLYHHVASATSWNGVDALEVGSGRGGGASFMMRYLQPNSLRGADLTANATSFCHRYHSIKGLSFMRGDAESLPFADDSFDVVINVESSHCYPHFGQFLSEVTRVLKPNGHFLYADFRNQPQLESWRQQLHDMRLELLKEENITPNVLLSLDMDHDRKQKLIDYYVPKNIRDPFYDFAGMKGSIIYRAFETGAKEYWRFAFCKRM